MSKLAYADVLNAYRARIDALDDEIVDLFVKRFSIIREVAEIKTAQGIPAILQDRVDEVRERCTARAVAAGLDEDFMRDLYARIITHACEMEQKRISEK